MFLKTTMMTVITSLMLSLTPTINATTTDFSKIVSQGITSGKKLLNITENKSYYFVIDSAYKLTRISKADGTKKAMSLPEGYEFGAYIKVEVSDDQKTLLADAGFRTVYVDLEKLKVISSIYKDVSEVPPGSTKNIFKGRSLRKNRYDNFMVQTLSNEDETDFVGGGEILNEAEKFVRVPSYSRKGEIFEAYLVATLGEVWTIVDNFLVVLDAETMKGKFAMELPSLLRGRRMSDYSASAGQFIVETNSEKFAVIDLKTKRVVKNLNVAIDDRVFAELKFINNGQHLAVKDGVGGLYVFETKNYQLVFDARKAGFDVQALFAGNNDDYKFLFFSAMKNSVLLYVAYDFAANKAYTLTDKDVNPGDIYLLDGFKLVGKSSGKESFYSIDLKALK